MDFSLSLPMCSSTTKMPFYSLPEVNGRSSVRKLKKDFAGNSFSYPFPFFGGYGSKHFCLVNRTVINTDMLLFFFFWPTTLW